MRHLLWYDFWGIDASLYGVYSRTKETNFHINPCRCLILWANFEIHCFYVNYCHFCISETHGSHYILYLFIQTQLFYCCTLEECGCRYEARNPPSPAKHRHSNGYTKMASLYKFNNNLKHWKIYSFKIIIESDLALFSYTEQVFLDFFNILYTIFFTEFFGTSTHYQSDVQVLFSMTERMRNHHEVNSKCSYLIPKILKWKPTNIWSQKNLSLRNHFNKTFTAQSGPYN